MSAKNPWQSELKSLVNDKDLILNQNPLSIIREFYCHGR